MKSGQNATEKRKVAVLTRQLAITAFLLKTGRRKPIAINRFHLCRNRILSLSDST